MMRRVILCVAFALVATSAQAATDIIADCRLGEGYAYYEPGSLTPGSARTWQKDGWPQQQHRVLLVKNGSEYDLIARDAIGSSSASGVGAKVILLGGGRKDALTVTAIYPQQGSVETFVFVTDGAVRSLLWTSARQGNDLLSPRVGAFQGPCD